MGTVKDAACSSLEYITSPGRRINLASYQANKKNKREKTTEQGAPPPQKAMRFSFTSLAFVAAIAVWIQRVDAVRNATCPLAQPNIVVLLSDDQDRRLGSLDYQSAVQRELIAKGTEFVNHYATVAQCCPSRASLFRGQAGHNTNITHVSAPGGNYDKFVLTGEDTDHLPFWLKSAGHRVECEICPALSCP